MFCSKCGNQVPDGSASCPNCGASFAAPEAAPVAPVQEPIPAAPVAPAPVAQDPNAAPYAAAPVAAPVAAAPKAPASFDLDFGGFFKDFFSKPLEAVTSRASQKFWLLGLIVAGAYALIDFILVLIDAGDYKPAAQGFNALFIQIFSIAALVSFAMLFTGVFKIKKMNWLASLGLIGLSFLPYCASLILAFINSKIYNAMKINFFSISPIFNTIAMLFIVLVIYDYANEHREVQATKNSVLFYTLTTWACYLVCNRFFQWMFGKMFF